jgi:hypothetical protein
MEILRSLLEVFVLTLTWGSLRPQRKPVLGASAPERRYSDDRYDLRRRGDMKSER